MLVSKRPFDAFAAFGKFGLSTGFCRSLREGRETENQA